MNRHIIAHIREYDQKKQTLWDHLIETSQLSGVFAHKIGLRDSGELLGLLHDLGKASKEFQNYIGSASGLIDPDSDQYIDPIAKKGEIDHSSAGAQFVYQALHHKGPLENLAAQILGLCLASHHSGLIDCLSPDGEDRYTRRMNKSEEKTHLGQVNGHLDESELIHIQGLLAKNIGKQLASFMNELREPNDSKQTVLFKNGLLIRFLFSCLIDADRLSTANFEVPANALIRNSGHYTAWNILIKRLNLKIQDFENKNNKNEVDQIRNRISNACLTYAKKPKGIYVLTVPTGGGKTLASLRFALHHADEHGLDRIIYVIPYTSIIDQNAETVREILEDRDEFGNKLDRVVLEHHSNLTPEEETRRQGLLAQNWDAPVVFTTQVQFLEVLFGHGTRGARRMHQLANTLIIFDEVQTIPVRCIHMFNVALRFLTRGCGASVLLCTATQPLLDQVEPKFFALPVEPPQHIIQDEQQLFNSLKRVDVFDRRKTGGWKDDEIADLAATELQKQGSVLIIVNTRKKARSLFQVINDRKLSVTYHLSTNMCPAHRLDVLRRIKDDLRERKPIICVSTQLIEAGVDVDFGSVIRSLAGLDSIAQAAGRCNRNGLRVRGNVWIVNLEGENTQRLADIAIGQSHAERVLDEFKAHPEEFGNDPIGLELMNSYFRYYFYHRSDEMRYKVGASSPVGRDDDLFNLLSTNTLSEDAHKRVNANAPQIIFRQAFQTAAKAFSVIDSPARGVIVPFSEEGRAIVAGLLNAHDLEKQYRLLKLAQRYAVNLLPQEFEEMVEKNAIKPVQENAAVFFMEPQFYNLTFGWTANPADDDGLPEA